MLGQFNRCSAARALIALLIASSPQGAGATASDRSPWATTIYVGQFFHDHLQDIIFTDALFTESNYFDSRIVTLSLAREFWRSGSFISGDVEGMVGKHFGMQGHVEVNALLAARWHPFPWDRLIDTSFAVGNGLSWASEPPYMEGDFRNKRAYQVLNYLFVEFAGSVPAVPAWTFLSRVHHRSGAFGLFGTGEGSNFIGFGLRHRF